MALSRDDMLRELELLPVWRARHVEPQPESIKSVSEAVIALPIENIPPPTATVEVAPSEAAQSEAAQSEAAQSEAALLNNTSAKPMSNLCVVCSLVSFSQLTGAVTADCLLVGLAPEDSTLNVSELFAGWQGELLNNMLAAIKLKLAAERFTPFNSPRTAETQTAVMLVVGESAAQSLLASDASLDDLRGRLHVVQGHRGNRHHVVATYHPAHLLQHPADKAKAWQDLLLVKRAMADLQL